MKTALLSLALLIALAADSAFNGVWVIDVGSVLKGGRPEPIAVSGGIFSRGQGEAYTIVRADGRFHRVKSDGYVDSMAVTIVDRRRVREVDRFGGKLVYTVTYTVSADGRTMTRVTQDFTKTDGKPFVTTTTDRRVGPPPRTGSLVWGRWATIGLSTSQEYLSQTLTLKDGHFASSGPGSLGYDAVIGGPPTPMRGDAPDAQITVKMTDARTVVLVMSNPGKPDYRVTMVLQPDDRTIVLTSKGTAQDRSWIMRKR